MFCFVFHVLVFLFYRTSLQYGINSLKRVNYDRNELEARREDSNNEMKGKPSFFQSLIN